MYILEGLLSTKTNVKFRKTKSRRIEPQVMIMLQIDDFQLDTFVLESILNGI